MPSFSQQVGRFEVVIQCRADLEEQARHVFRILGTRGADLRDGVEIPIGWSSLYPHADEKAANRLVLHEPDFAGDALHAHRPDVSTTLALHSTQLWIAQQAGAPFTRCTYRQRLAVTPRGCLTEERLSLSRTTAPRFPDDCGWLVSAGHGVPRAPQADRELLYGYELMARRPALVQALGLPYGYVVKFVGDQLEAIGKPD